MSKHTDSNTPSGALAEGCLDMFRGSLAASRVHDTQSTWPSSCTLTDSKGGMNRCSRAVTGPAPLYFAVRILSKSLSSDGPAVGQPAYLRIRSMGNSATGTSLPSGHTGKSFVGMSVLSFLSHLLANSRTQVIAS